MTRRLIKVLFIIINSGNNLNAISAICVYKNVLDTFRLKNQIMKKKKSDYRSSHNVQCPIHLKNERMGDFPSGPVVKDLSMQGTQVRSLVQEDATSRGATKPEL